MRLEFAIEMSKVETPRFAVEAVEGIGKLFTLATVVLNVLDERPSVEIVFHGLNPDDPDRKIAAYKDILGSAPSSPTLVFSEGESGSVPGSSSYYRWLIVKKS